LALERGGICGKLTLTEVQQGDANPPSVRTEGGSSGPLQHRIKIELIVSPSRDAQSEREPTASGAKAPVTILYLSGDWTASKSETSGVGAVKP